MPSSSSIAIQMSAAQIRDALHTLAGDRRFISEFMKFTKVLYTNTFWDDLSTDLAFAKGAGIQDPDFSKFQDDGSGSTGVYAWHFSKTLEESLLFNIEIKHPYTLGTNFKPHIHWAPTNTDTGNVIWGLECTLAEEHNVFPNTSFLSVTDAADGVARKQQEAKFGDIDGSGITTTSAIMMCRLFRDATSELDTYNADAVATFIDLHIEIDAPGSELEEIKFE